MTKDQDLDVNGDWLSGYSKIHEGIISGTFPAHRRRFAVWTCSELNVPAGLANRLLGIISAFLYAILTERALIIEWPGDEASHLANFLYSPYLRTLYLLTHVWDLDEVDGWACDGQLKMILSHLDSDAESYELSIG
ncbi:hypothetical protein GUITHDRAFT_145721 [Guillardia theta CCMP2712]|uniref:Uncharacterized protein n=1 Tax=Guillardia theta (strain CCMP2712) TaxID=905079 RepID=L1IJN8_GUITC|nr:hypothetical protein GUITHDRAFT_145721 [Guillardia theta CCMP2712]EKX36451.1 hypothetical protein GUITHDRAFT_145721 [Guillardia theta CCMP2712]|eukprot:XP_005823431.1 hypothetical protein GUITHDRAFT_145721 [Guillardia theta CCMP2712]